MVLKIFMPGMIQSLPYDENKFVEIVVFQYVLNTEDDSDKKYILETDWKKPEAI